jgi:hypothetical protein
MKYRIKDLTEIMCVDTISTPEKITSLKEELNLHYHREEFLNCKNMGEIVNQSIKLILEKNRVG